MKTPIHNTRRTRRGFSLPEVTFAVAVSALGLTSILGLVPNSLDNLKRAGDIATESRINQQIVTTVSTAEWTDTKGNDTLADTFDKKRFYFDDIAVPTTDNGEGLVSYVAEVEVVANDVRLSTDDQKTDADPFLRRVKVKLANTAAKSFNFAGAKPNTYRVYTSLVARAGR